MLGMLESNEGHSLMDEEEHELRTPAALRTQIRTERYRAVSYANIALRTSAIGGDSGVWWARSLRSDTRATSLQRRLMSIEEGASDDVQSR